MSQYATPAELEATGLPARAFEEIDSGKVRDILVLVSGLMDSYMRGRYKLPISGELEPVNTFPAELRACCLAIGAYDLLVFRGFNPDEYDSNFKTRRDFYVGTPGMKGWLDKLSAGAVSLDLALDASPDVAEGGGFVVDGSARGFGSFEGNGVGIGEPIGNFWGGCKGD